MQPTGPIEPVVEEGLVRNAGGTILGADNKAAVAAMLDAVRIVLVENRSHAGIELVFTTREETGCRGAAAFDASRLHGVVGFVYDHAAPIGDIVVAAPTSGRSTSSSEGTRLTRGSTPRKAAPQSRPLPERSQTSDWAGSTSRRQRTSVTSRAEVPAT